MAHFVSGDNTFNSLAQGQAALRKALATRAILLVLDDVWRTADAQLFDVMGPRCRALVTTRDKGILDTLRGVLIPVSLFTETEALQLLADTVNVPPAGLPAEARDFVHECGCLPLALALCGAMARKRGGDFHSVLERLRRADLEKITDRATINEQHRSIWRAMQASVEMLPDEEQQRFAELSVFDTDQTVLEAAAAILWEHTGGLDELDSEELLINLSDRSLVQLDQKMEADGTVLRRFRLHDLLHDYAVRIAGEPRSLNEKLVDAYRKKCPDGWHSGPNEDYFWTKIARHILQARHFNELYEIGRDELFAAAQQETIGPESQLSTLRTTLQGAIEEDNPGSKAEFCLRHARKLMQLREANIGTEWLHAPAAAMRLAGQQEPERMILWFLYFVEDQARWPASVLSLCLDHITSVEPFLPRMLGRQADLAAELLPALVELNQDLLVRLATRLLHDEERSQLTRNVARTHPALSLEIGNGISDEEWRAAAFRSIIEVSVDSSSLEATERAKFLNEVVTSIRSLSGIGDRSTSLVVVARAYAPFDRERAIAILVEAEALARQVTAELAQANTLITVARAFAQLDLDKARSLLFESEALARHLDDETEQASTLIAVAEALAECGFSGAETIIDQAAGLVSKINDDSPRRSSELANLLSVVASQTSRAVVRRVNILSAAGKALTRLSPQSAQAVFSEAIAMARAIGPSESRDDSGICLERNSPKSMWHKRRGGVAVSGYCHGLGRRGGSALFADRPVRRSGRSDWSGAP